ARAPAAGLGRLGNAHEAGAGHLEATELVRRADAVLDGAEDPVLAVAVALELEHAVDQVLEDTRARDGAVLRDVAHQEDGDAVLLGDTQKPAGGLADLRNRAGR